MREEVTRQAPAPAPADPATVASKRTPSGASRPPADDRVSGAEPVARGVQIGATSRIQRRLVGVIQRDDDEEDDDSEGVDTPSLAIADVTGEENGPEAMKAKFDEAEKAARTSAATIATLALTTPTLINVAKKVVTTAENLVDTAEAIADEVETKKEATNDLQDDVSISDEDLGLLQDASTAYDKIFPAVKSSFYKLNEFYLEESGKVGLAEVSASEGQAQTLKMNALRGKWGSAALAKGHYDKHASDTKATSEEDYLTRAQVHNNLAAGGKILQKVKGKDTLTFNTATGDFGVKSNEGARQIRTFFRPNNGRKYYDKQ